MSNEIEGTYTLRQVLLLTQHHFGNRYFYKERDVLKTVHIRKVTELHPDRHAGAPNVRYEISTRSYPQYKPYTIGRIGVKQRKYFHDYDTVLTMDELSLETYFWKARVGSNKKIKDAPPTKIKTVSRELRAKWKREQDAKIRQARNDIELREARNYVKKKIADHRKKAPYLNQGDWVAKVLGVNLDFAYRDAFAFKSHGHLYGNWGYPLDRPSKLNRRNIMFCPKHLLRLLQVLLNRGILS